MYAVALFTVSSSAWSADFTIEDGVFVTSQQTLSSGETGTINSGGGITTSATAIAVSNASNITVLNNGANSEVRVVENQNLLVVLDSATASSPDAIQLLYIQLHSYVLK